MAFEDAALLSSPDAGTDIGNDTGDVADTGGSDEQELDLGTDDAAVDEGDGSEGDAAEQDSDGEPGETEGKPATGKMTPEKMRAFCNELKKTNPEAAAEVAKAYFKTQEYAKVFPSVKDAAIAKQTLESVGGAQGLTELQGKADQFANEIVRLGDGDPTILDELAADAPEGFVKLAPHYLQKLYDTNKEAYFDTLAPVFANTFNTVGLPDGIAAMSEQIEAAYDAIQKSGSKTGLNELAAAWRVLKGKDGSGGIAKFVSDVTNAATKAKTKQVDPERQKLAAERKEFETGKEKAFYDSVSNTSTEHLKGVVTKGLAPYLKTRKIGSEARGTLDGLIKTEIEKRMMADPDFKRNYSSLYKAKDENRLKALMRTKITELSPDAIKAVWKRLYGTAPATKAGAGKTAAKGTVTKGQRPRREDIDLGWLAANQVAYIGGKAKLKNGNFVVFDPNA